MIVTTAQLFKIAYGKYAIGAYNINNLEQTVGLFKGNVDSKAPFIIQLSRGARKYTDKRYLEAMIRTSQEVFPDAIFAVHLDHGDEQTCYDCIASGFYSSVMIDASHETFEKNVEITKRVVEKAHARGLSVEAELGMLGGVEEDIVGHVSLTDPDEAKIFVEQTKCDSLAVAIGTSHGAYKFKAEPGNYSPASRWSCTAAPACRRTKWIASTRRAARWKRPAACLREISYRPPNSASAKSTSTLTAASSGPACIVNSSAITPTSSTSAIRARFTSRNTPR
jgi:Fructose-bisphosphate aldolase class-II